jgi:hypothetical protein
LSQGSYLGSIYSYRDRSGVRGFGTDRQGALQFQAETHGAITETRLWAVSDNSWALNLSLFVVSSDGIPFEPRRINPVEASILKKTIVKATNNTDLCKKYIADLIQKVAANGKKSADDIISTDIPTLFDKVLGSRSSTPNASNVNERGGIFITGYGHGSSFSHNYWEWVGGGVGFASLRLEFAGDTPPVFKTLTPDEQFSIRYDSITRQIETPGLGGMTAIHELIHVAVKGIGNDIDLAKAAAELAGEKFDPKDGDIVSQASQYWDDRLNQACGYPSSISRKMTNYKLYK